MAIFKNLLADWLVIGRLDRIERILSNLVTLNMKLAETIDQVVAEMKSQTTAIQGLDVLIQNLSDQVAAAISGAADLAEAETKVEALFDVVQENKDALVAAAAVNTPAETPADVAAVEEFESLPPQNIDEPLS